MAWMARMARMARPAWPSRLGKCGWVQNGTLGPQDYKAASLFFLGNSAYEKSGQKSGQKKETKHPDEKIKLAKHPVNKNKFDPNSQQNNQIMEKVAKGISGGIF